MAATVTHEGSYSATITNITLASLGVETVAHGLPTAPSVVIVEVKGVGTNTSLGGLIAVESKDATNIVFRNPGGQAINGVAFAIKASTIIA